MLIIRVNKPVKIKKPLIINLSIDPNDQSAVAKLEVKEKSFMNNEDIP